MEIARFMNPNQKNVETNSFLPAGIRIWDIDQRVLNTEEKYIGIVDENGEMLGAIQTERLRFIYQWNQTLDMAQILEHLSIGVIAVDKDSRIFYVNPAYSDILNVAPGKIIGRYMNQIEKDAALLEVLETQQPKRSEKQLIQSVQKYVSVNMFPLYRQGKFVGACSLFTDITELNHLTSEVQRISQVAEEYNQEIRARDFLKTNHIIGESEVYLNCIRKAMMVASTDASVLIRGENGTGKEVICKLIQENSARMNQPFIKVNCAAIPEALIESELFGYEEGSFTGAKKGGRAGKFELAHGGTIFLDEIGDLPMAMQAKLLRVLQEGEIEKVGGQKSVPIDVRVIAATNQPLEQMIEDGTFRMDLYFRLNVISIEIPPLRKRGSDIILLANEFLDTFNHKYQKEKHLKESAYQALMNYKWPGNVRELRNVVESAVVLTMSDSIGAGDLPEHISGVAVEETVQQDGQTKELSMLEDDMHFDSLKEQVEAYEKHVIAAALERCHGDRNAVIQELKVSRRTFYRKLSEYGLS